MEKSELTLTCPYCGKTFASAIQMDPPTWEGIRMPKGLLETCPHCGHASRFAKRDYLFRSN